MTAVDATISKFVRNTIGSVDATAKSTVAKVKAVGKVNKTLRLTNTAVRVGTRPNASTSFTPATVYKDYQSNFKDGIALAQQDVAKGVDPVKIHANMISQVADPIDQNRITISTNQGSIQQRLSDKVDPNIIIQDLKDRGLMNDQGNVGDLNTGGPSDPWFPSSTRLTVPPKDYIPMYVGEKFTTAMNPNSGKVNVYQTEQPPISGKETIARVQEAETLRHSHSYLDNLNRAYEAQNTAYQKDPNNIAAETEKILRASEAARVNVLNDLKVWTNKATPGSVFTDVVRTKELANQQVMDSAKRAGVDVVSYDGESFVWRSKDGQQHEYSASFMDSLIANGGTIVMGAALGIAATAALPEEAVVGLPIAAKVLMSRGPMAAGAVGSAVGGALDQLRAAWTLHQDSSLAEVVHRAKGEAAYSMAADVVLGVIGKPAMLIGKHIVAPLARAGWRKVKLLGDALKHDSLNTAFDFMKNDLFLTNRQVRQRIADAQDIGYFKGPKIAINDEALSDAEMKAGIGIVGLSDKTAAEKLGKAASITGDMGAKAAKFLEQQSQQLLDTIDANVPKELSPILTADLNAAKETARTNYNKTQAAGSLRMMDSKYPGWNFGDLADKAATASSDIEDPAAKEHFLSWLGKLRDLKQHPANFADTQREEVVGKLVKGYNAAQSKAAEAKALLEEHVAKLNTLKETKQASTATGKVDRAATAVTAKETAYQRAVQKEQLSKDVGTAIDAVRQAQQSGENADVIAQLRKEVAASKGAEADYKKQIAKEDLKGKVASSAAGLEQAKGAQALTQQLHRAAVLVKTQERIYKKAQAQAAMLGANINNVSKVTTSEGAHNVAGSFDDLLSMNRALNKYQREHYNTIVKTPALFKAYTAAKDAVVKEIQRASSVYMPKGKQWYGAFKRANAEYGTMANIMQESVVKDLRGGKLSVSQEVDKIDKLYGEGSIRAFSMLWSKLSPARRTNLGLAVIKKRTMAATSSEGIIDFRALHNSLKDGEFYDKTSRDVQATVANVAKVFENSPLSHKVLTGSTLPSASVSSMAMNLLGKFHIALISKTYNWVMAHVPVTKDIGRHAFVRHLSRFLEDPTSEKNFSALLKEVGNNSEIRTQMETVMTYFAAAGRRVYDGTTKLWKVGNQFYRKKVPGGEEVRRDTKIYAPVDQLTNILGEHVKNPLRLSRLQQDALAKIGYDGIDHGSFIKLFYNSKDIN